jgi:ribonuclease HI
MVATSIKTLLWLHRRSITQPDPSVEKVWTIHCDDAWCHAEAGAAAVITSPTGVKHRYAARLSFALESDRCTNNIAEYEVVILGLRKLRALGVTTCIIRTDSKVVANVGDLFSNAMNQEHGNTKC